MPIHAPSTQTGRELHRQEIRESIRKPFLNQALLGFDWPFNGIPALTRVSRRGLGWSLSFNSRADLQPEKKRLLSEGRERSLGQFACWSNNDRDLS